MKRCNFSEKYYSRSLNALKTGLETAPAYSAWKKLDPGDDSPVDKRYSAMPALTKEDIRNNFPGGLVPGNRNVTEGLDSGEIEYIQTSGTTSEKVTNLWNQAWWNASEASSWTLNAHTAHLNHSFREAQLTSALSVGFHSEKDLPMESRILNGRFLFLNEKTGANEWHDYHYERMVRELNEFRPAVLEANPSYLARLSWWAIDHGIKPLAPEIIIFTYELPSPMQISSIRRVFPVPMASSYGTTEAGYVFMECENGTMHQNTDFCRVDFEPLKTGHGGPDIGRILVTTFDNSWVSLLRFDVGDLVKLHKTWKCPCGRNEGFMLSSLEGRVTNSTFTTGGRLVTTGETDKVLSEIKDVRDYHLEQLSQKEFLVKIISDGSGVIEPVRKALISVYGSDSRIDIEPCADILPGPSGKYRRTQANFDFDIKGYLA